MANLKEIRDRIVSVKNTRKITEAMRLVAAAKVRRAQDQVLKSRPFADKLARVLENIQSRVQFEAVDSPLLSKRGYLSRTADSFHHLALDRALDVLAFPNAQQRLAWLERMR